MSGIWSEQEAEAGLNSVLQRAATDDGFRELCLKDPAAAVREATGRDLPEGFHLRIVENAGADLTIVLPDRTPENELSDADLEAVAGGAGKDAKCGVSKICGVSKGTDPQPQL